MSNPLVQRLSVGAAAGTYLLLLLGGYVSATGSGLACPDWPLCHGRLIPPMQPDVLIEWSHRLVASIIGLVILANAIVLFRAGPLPPGVRTAAVLSVVLLPLQVVLGGLTVLSELAPVLSTAHLALAMVIFSSLVFIAVRVREAWGSPGPAQSLRLRVAWTALAVFALILLGGYMSGVHAGLACPDWPLCGGRVIPQFDPGVGVHFAHRLGALVVGALLVALAVEAARRAPGGTPRSGGRLVTGARLALGLYLFQVLLGALSVLFRLPPILVTLHLGTAAAILATLVYLHAAAGVWQASGPTSGRGLPPAGGALG